MRGRVFSYRHDPSTGKTVKSAERQEGAKWAYEFAVADPSTGKRRSKSGAGFPTRTAAQRALTAALAEYEQLGRRLPDEPSKMALSAFIVDEWLPKAHGQSKPTTRENYRQLHRAYVEPHIGAMPLRDVTAGHLTRLFELLEQRGGRTGRPLSPMTVHHVYVLLASAFEFAREEGLVRTNPARAISRKARRKQPKRSPDKLRHWTPAQASTFLRSTSSDRLHAMYVVALMIGLRRGELAGLQWSDIDFDAGTLAVRRQRTTVGYEALESSPKTQSAQRTIELDPSIVGVLRRYRKRLAEEQLGAGAAWAGPAAGWVFVDELGVPLHPQQIYTKLQAASRRAELPWIGVHGLRHTCAVAMLARGVPLKVVSERLGHTSTTFTADLYQHVVPGMQRAASAELAQAFGLS